MDGWQLGEKSSKWILDTFAGSNSRILELGCGAGTALRAEIFDLTAVEHDDAYVLENVNIISAPITPNPISMKHGESGWYDLSALEPLRDEWFDLLIVDGPPGAIGRTGLLAVPWLIRRCKCIMVDDTHRPAELQLATSLEAMLINVERQVLVEESEWGQRMTTVLTWSERFDQR